MLKSSLTVSINSSSEMFWFCIQISSAADSSRRLLIIWSIALHIEQSPPGNPLTFLFRNCVHGLPILSGMLQNTSPQKQHRPKDERLLNFYLVIRAERTFETKSNRKQKKDDVREKFKMELPFGQLMGIFPHEVYMLSLSLVILSPKIPFQ